MEDLFVRADNERRRLFGVEGAIGAEVPSRPLERDIRRDELDDIAAIQDVTNEIVWIQSGHYL